MIIKLSPSRSDKNIAIVKTGDTLTINAIVCGETAVINETFDFSVIPDGGILPNDAITSDFITSDVERIDGEIRLTLLYPHGPNATYAQRFPDPITVTTDGEVQLP